MPGKDRGEQGNDDERRQVARRTKRQRSNVGFAGAAGRRAGWGWGRAEKSAGGSERQRQETGESSQALRQIS